MCNLKIGLVDSGPAALFLVWSRKAHAEELVLQVGKDLDSWLNTNTVLSGENKLNWASQDFDKLG